MDRQENKLRNNILFFCTFMIETTGTGKQNEYYGVLYK
jgi:hypothetical protein